MKRLRPVYLGSNTYKRKLNKSKVVSTFKKYFYINFSCVHRTDHERKIL